MTGFRIPAAAAVLSLMFATPVFAQAAIQEPGAFAFYYPNNDVLNGGLPTPAAGPNPPMPYIYGSNPYLAALDNSVDAAACAAHRSARMVLGYDRRWHTCK